MMLQKESNNELIDVVIIGAGAAGLFCAAQAGQLGHQVVVVDGGKIPGRKILMSGGGRCNFTNLYADATAYLSQNPHFCKSALARFTQWDFLDLINRYQISWHEKAAGQLFCDNSAEDIVNLLKQECEKGHVELRMRSQVLAVQQTPNNKFLVQLEHTTIEAKSLIVATGGLSMPGLGAAPFGYQIAQQFGLTVVPTRAALVPFTLQKPLLDVLQVLSGIAVPAVLTAECGIQFKESLLFTHRGLSGPAVLQLSGYWQQGEHITIDLLPDVNLDEFFANEKQQHPNQLLKNSLAKLLPKRLIECLQALTIIPEIILKQISDQQMQTLNESLHQWKIQPNGTEGYRTAEVTLGGVDTQALSSKTMEAKKVPNLYFIGEVLDVTGWLGGYNFQWAWSSAWACAQSLR